MQPLPEYADIEIHQESNFQSRELKVGHKLGSMHWQNGFYGFEFYYYLLINQQVYAESGIDLY